MSRDQTQSNDPNSPGQHNPNANSSSTNLTADNQDDANNLLLNASLEEKHDKLLEKYAQQHEKIKILKQGYVEKQKEV